MWIQLTEVGGSPIAINSGHVVSVQVHGTRTKITHLAGQAIVIEEISLVLAALGLRPMETPSVLRDPDQPLHS